MSQPTQLSSLSQRPLRTATASMSAAGSSAAVSDVFVSIGCVSVRRYAAQHTVYPMWPQGIEKSRVELRVVSVLDPRQSSPSTDGSTFKQQAFRTPVRMCIRTCDGVSPACSVEFTTKGQNVISEFWDRATLIRGSMVTVVSGSTNPGMTAGSGVMPQQQQKALSVTIPAVTVLLTFDVRRDAKMFEEFLHSVFESESGLLAKSLHRSVVKNTIGGGAENTSVAVVNSAKQTTGMHASGRSNASLRSHRGGGGDGLATSNDASKNKKSCFDERTDESSSSQYFQFYSYLSQQQNMLQDYLRTATYQRAILSNLLDFLGKTVMDVGAGSGILSFFAVQAGARRVYAVEASSMAVHCRRLIEANGLQDKIICINKKLEEIDSLGPNGELVDLIISEPLGYMLVNERMLETYLHAKKFLKPGGNMYPSQADLHCAPFCDESLYMEQLGKANFWHQNNFYGIDLSSLRSAAFEENFRQPIVDTFDMRILMAPSIKYTIDFLKATEDDLHRIHIPIEFVMHHNGTVHGLCFWFDAAFRGSEKTVWLSTAPSQPLTHWYQVRCLLQQPLYCIRGQTLYGSVTLTANARQSYDIEIIITNSTTGSVATNQLDLKSPCFRMFAAAAVASTTAAAVSNPVAAASGNVIMQQSSTALPALLVQQQQQQTTTSISAATAGSMPYATQSSINASGFGGATSMAYSNNTVPLNSNVMFVAGNSANYNSSPTNSAAVGLFSSTPTGPPVSSVPAGSVFSSSSPFRFSSTSTTSLLPSVVAGNDALQQQQHQQAVMSSFSDLILQQQQALQQQQQQAALSTAGNDAVINVGGDADFYNEDSLKVPGALNGGGNTISAMMADVVITSPNSGGTVPATSMFSLGGQPNSGNIFHSSSKSVGRCSKPSSSSNSAQSSHHHPRRGDRHHHHHHRTTPQQPVAANDVGPANGEASANGEV